MARPITRAEKMDAFIQFRATTADIANIKTAAKRKAITPSELIRQLLLENHIILP